MVEVIQTPQTPCHKSGCLWAENKIGALDAMMHTAFDLEASRQPAVFELQNLVSVIPTRTR
jgi:hypothetical protein